MTLYHDPCDMSSCHHTLTPPYRCRKSWLPRRPWHWRRLPRTFHWGWNHTRPIPRLPTETIARVSTFSLEHWRMIIFKDDGRVQRTPESSQMARMTRYCSRCLVVSKIWRTRHLAKDEISDYQELPAGTQISRNVYTCTLSSPQLQAPHPIAGTWKEPELASIVRCITAAAVVQSAIVLLALQVSCATARVNLLFKLFSDSTGQIIQMILWQNIVHSLELMLEYTCTENARLENVSISQNATLMRVGRPHRAKSEMAKWWITWIDLALLKRTPTAQVGEMPHWRLIFVRIAKPLGHIDATLRHLIAYNIS
jgi:hypothetical protein